MAKLPYDKLDDKEKKIRETKLNGCASLSDL
jgi:hypothetical protein